MARTYTHHIPLGFTAPSFHLPDTLSGTAKGYTDVRGEKATVVVFMCNHCPFVVHILDRLLEQARTYIPKGIGFVAISANDVANYPDDHPDKMRELALQKAFPFPYLYDEDQTVAKAYDAACTPDFSVFDANDRCVYRGRFDASTPGNDHPVTGADLQNVLDQLLRGEHPSPDNQLPSLGCNIKWKSA